MAWLEHSKCIVKGTQAVFFSTLKSVYTYKKIFFPKKDGHRRVKRWHFINLQTFLTKWLIYFGTVQFSLLCCFQLYNFKLILNLPVTVQGMLLPCLSGQASSKKLKTNSRSTSLNVIPYKYASYFKENTFDICIMFICYFVYTIFTPWIWRE